VVALTGEAVVAVARAGDLAIASACAGRAMLTRFLRRGPGLAGRLRLRRRCRLLGLRRGMLRLGSRGRRYTRGRRLGAVRVRLLGCALAHGRPRLGPPPPLPPPPPGPLPA